MLQFDEETAKQVEATYQTPDVVEQRRATRALLALRPGERVLDIGSGPGFLAAEMAAEVGPEGKVVGVDPSDSMLEMGRRRDAGFDLAEATIIPILNRGSDPEAFSRGVMPVIANFVGDPEWAEDLLGLGDDYFFSLNRYVFVAYKS